VPFYPFTDKSSRETVKRCEVDTPTTITIIYDILWKMAK